MRRFGFNGLSYLHVLSQFVCNNNLCLSKPSFVASKTLTKTKAQSPKLRNSRLYSNTHSLSLSLYIYIYEVTYILYVVTPERSQTKIYDIITR